CSASSTMYFAARSLTDPPGFRNSALPRIVQPVSSDALRSLISGVLPTASTKSSRMPAVNPAAWFPSPLAMNPPVIPYRQLDRTNRSPVRAHAASERRVVAARIVHSGLPLDRPPEEHRDPR